MGLLSFKPKQVAKRLLAPIPERTRDVIIMRFGLLGGEGKTLDAIGKQYGITRERVRQIETFGLAAIKKSDAFTKEMESLSELEKAVSGLGGIVSEEDLLAALSKDPNTQNHLLFFLTLSDSFVRAKEDDEFKHRWYTDGEIAKQVEESLKKLYDGLSDEDLIAEPDIVSRFLDHLKDVADQYKNEEIAKRWLNISKKIGRNPLGEWGISDSPNVRARGMRDYAFLVIRRHGNPMHFTEVARSIEKTFGKAAHTATCHNELIKDPRFVLVGRGLYALHDWGYTSGVVRDVIREVLKKYGPLTKEEITDRVLKERYVKPNTILVNLQNGKHFKKDASGRYATA
ncbi:MAG: sigma factor-like helix-turn-helix DNA-binding protein [Patescibacteria group bacterium]